MTREPFGSLKDGRPVGIYEEDSILVIAPDPSEIDPAVSDEATFRTRLGLPQEKPETTETRPEKDVPPKSKRKRELWIYLAVALLVAACNHDLGLRRRAEGNAFRYGIVDGVRKSETQVQHLALALGTVADTNKFQLFLETLADAMDHIAQQRAHGSGHRPGRVIGWGDTENSVVKVYGNGRMDIEFHGPFAAFYRDALTVDLDLDALGHFDRSFCYT